MEAKSTLFMRRQRIELGEITHMLHSDQIKLTHPPFHLTSHFVHVPNLERASNLSLEQRHRSAATLRGHIWNSLHVLHY